MGQQPKLLETAGGGFCLLIESGVNTGSHRKAIALVRATLVPVRFGRTGDPFFRLRSG